MPIEPEALLEAEIDAVLAAESGGDARAAIRALLHDLTVLAADAEASTSRGYVRGKMVRLEVGREGRRRAERS